VAGVSSALGPFIGGWLVDAVSWRPVFLINLPLAAVAGYAAWRHVLESREPDAPPSVDVVGAVLVSSGLAVLTYGLIESIPLASIVGALLLVGFVVAEAQVPYPLLPLAIFRSRQFTGANLTTFAVYAALSSSMFLVVVQLQNGLGYSALEAGCALLPVTIITPLLSAPGGPASATPPPVSPSVIRMSPPGGSRPGCASSEVSPPSSLSGRPARTSRS
jgi:MFS family permease